jgi:hypothetical protein
LHFLCLHSRDHHSDILLIQAKLETFPCLSFEQESTEAWPKAHVAIVCIEPKQKDRREGMTRHGRRLVVIICLEPEQKKRGDDKLMG